MPANKIRHASNEVRYMFWAIARRDVGGDF